MMVWGIGEPIVPIMGKIKLISINLIKLTVESRSVVQRVLHSPHSPGRCLVRTSAIDTAVVRELSASSTSCVSILPHAEYYYVSFLPFSCFFLIANGTSYFFVLCFIFISFYSYPAMDLVCCLESFVHCLISLPRAIAT